MYCKVKVNDGEKEMCKRTGYSHLFTIKAKECVTADSSSEPSFREETPEAEPKSRPSNHLSITSLSGCIVSGIIYQINPSKKSEPARAASVLQKQQKKNQFSAQNLQLLDNDEKFFI